MQLLGWRARIAGATNTERFICTAPLLGLLAQVIPLGSITFAIAWLIFCVRWSLMQCHNASRAIPMMLIVIAALALTTYGSLAFTVSMDAFDQPTAMPAPAWSQYAVQALALSLLTLVAAAWLVFRTLPRDAGDRLYGTI